MTVTEKLADALTLAYPRLHNMLVSTEQRQQMMDALKAYEATPKGEVKSNKAWREECQLLRADMAELVETGNAFLGCLPLTGGNHAAERDALRAALERVGSRLHC